MPEESHIYASTALGWAVGDTREECIKRLAAQAGADIIKRNKERHGGLYVWTCIVRAPKKAEYGIENYAPVGVKYDSVEEANITSARGKYQSIV